MEARRTPDVSFVQQEKDKAAKKKEDAVMAGVSVEKAEDAVMAGVSVVEKKAEEVLHAVEKKAEDAVMAGVHTLEAAAFDGIAILEDKVLEEIEEGCCACLANLLAKKWT